MSNSTNPASVEISKRLTEFATAIGQDFDIVTGVFKEKLGIDTTKDPDSSLEILDNEEYLTFGDLAKHFSSSEHAVALPTLRYAIRKLRPKTSPVNTDKQDTLSTTDVDTIANSIQALASQGRPKSEWADRELLESLNREDTEIAKILFERSHGRKFVVFKRGTDIVDVELSLRVLKIAKRQATGEDFAIDDVMVSLFRAGDYPALILEESPLHSGVALADGYCMKSKTNWSGINKNARIFVRLCVMDDPQMSKRDRKALFNLAKQGFDSLKSEYPEIFLKYDELEQADRLPKLSILSGSANKNNHNTIDKGY